MKKRIFSLFLAIVMVAGLLPGVTLHAHAETCTEHVDEIPDCMCDLCGESLPHTYDNEEYHQSPSYHYAMCDVCGSWDGSNSDFHEDSDSDCICDVCEYSMHQIDTPEDQGDENHQGTCTVCEETVTMPHIFELEWDDEGHWYICECGAVEVNSWNNHTVENSCWYSDNQMHYRQCVNCNYHLPEGEAHTFTDEDIEDGGDKECSTCGHAVHNYAWDEKTWDSVDHRVVCGVCGDEGWEAHYDGTDADELCDACDFNIACPHENTETQYDDDAHWSACKNCGQSISSPDSHSFDAGYYYQGSDKHYPECDGCKYYKADQGEAHVDEDEDGNCDVCCFWIHEHIYEDEYWVHDDGKHYLVCDLCYEYDRTTGEPCADTNGDHICDVCRYPMTGLCYDTDNDHICDVCDEDMYDLCTDKDGDHVCDAEACRRHMKELCFSESDCWICDVCGENFCNHYFDNEPLSNQDGTHKLLCRYCGEVTEDCYADMYESISDTTHTVICRCGYELPTEEHNFVWGERSVIGHTVVCDGCHYGMEWEAHTTQNGACTVCELQVTDYDDVYVGGKGLKNGQYLDNSGNVTATKPAGGYAYYEDGVLELNGYVYDGPGFLWVEYKSGEPDWAALYATTDLTLVLKGENSLKVTRPDAAQHERNYSDGITAQKNLTIQGDGSLSIQVNDDGIQTNPGDVTIEGGTLTVNSEDHGFDVGGSLTVTSGIVNVTAGADGFNVAGDITISGGTVSIDAEGYGLDSEGGSVTISDGSVDVVVEDWDGIWAYNSVVISGGSVDIVAEDWDGIWAYNSVVISGGIITIDSFHRGIDASEGVLISGGDLAVTSETGVPIWSEGSVTISGGNLELTAETFFAVVLAVKGITVENAQLPNGAEIELGEMYGDTIYIVEGHTLSIVTPFSAELKEDGSIKLTNKPWGLTVMIAAYDQDDKLIEIQVVNNPGEIVTPTVTGETVTAFFLNSGYAPVCAGLPIA